MMNKMKEYYIYDDEVYESEEAVEEAIIEKIGHNYNNIDVTQTGEYQDEVLNIEIVTVDEIEKLLGYKIKIKGEYTWKE